MKKQNKIIKIVGLLLIMLTFSCSVSKEMQPNDVITFPDKSFEKEVRRKIKKPKGDILYSDVSEITYIFPWGKEIKSIDGIQYFKLLEKLWLSNNQITDISPLKGLVNLRSLGLDDNKIVDYSVIYSLPKLEMIVFTKGDVVDITNYSKLKNITFWVYWKNSKGERKGRKIKLDKIKDLGKVTLDDAFINKYAEPKR